MLVSGLNGRDSPEGRQWSEAPLTTFPLGVGGADQTASDTRQSTTLRT